MNDNKLSAGKLRWPNCVWWVKANNLRQAAGHPAIEKQSHIGIPILLLFLMILLVSTFACTYTRWYYTPAAESIKGDAWSVDFCFYPIGARKPIKQGYDRTDTSYFYIVFLIESDTTIFQRLKFAVDNVYVTYKGLIEPITLQQEKYVSSSGEYDGATNVNHAIFFNSFRVPKPRPDTIYVDQDITIFYRDTGEKLTSFHYQTIAKLGRYQRWHIVDIIEGT